MHLAAAQCRLDRESNSTLFVSTHSRGDVVGSTSLVLICRFSSAALLCNSASLGKREQTSTLSLGACCALSKNMVDVFCSLQPDYRVSNGVACRDRFAAVPLSSCRRARPTAARSLFPYGMDCHPERSAGLAFSLRWGKHILVQDETLISTRYRAHFRCSLQLSAGAKMSRPRGRRTNAGIPAATIFFGTPHSILFRCPYGNSSLDSGYQIDSRSHPRTSSTPRAVLRASVTPRSTYSNVIFSRVRSGNSVPLHQVRSSTPVQRMTSLRSVSFDPLSEIAARSTGSRRNRKSAADPAVETVIRTPESHPSTSNAPTS